MVAARHVAWQEISVLTFDCYGTLIDWESGILETLMPLLRSHGRNPAEARVLELYGELEREAEAGRFANYKSVLRTVTDGIAAEYHFVPTAEERNCLVDSVARWRPFPDTVAALRALARRFRLGVISNVDDDLFSHTRETLGVHLEWVVTAEQVKSYKPSLANFHEAFRQIDLPPDRLVHVAQSLFHDIAPANKLGIRSVWVNRRLGMSGPGATPGAAARPDLEVPDLNSLVRLATV